MTFKTPANVTIPPNAVPPQGKGINLYRKFERHLTNNGQNEVNVADWMCNITEPGSGFAINANIVDGDPGFNNNFVSLSSLDNAEKTVLFTSNYDGGFDNAFDWATVFNGIFVIPQRNPVIPPNGNDSIGPVDIHNSRLPLVVDAAGATSDVFEIFSNNYLKIPNNTVTYIEKKCLFQPNNSAVGATSFILRSWINGTSTPFPMASWNIDVFDGSGSDSNPSGLLIDFSLIQTLVIEINNRGTGKLRVGFLIDDNYYFGHEFTSNNSSTELPFGNLNLPIIDYVYRTQGGSIIESTRAVGIFNMVSGITFEATTNAASTPTALLEYFDYSTSAYALGSKNLQKLKKRYTANMGTNYVTATPTGELLFALRPKEQLSGVDNNMIYNVTDFTVSTRTPNLDDEVLVELWWNAGGAEETAWQDLDFYSGLEINYLATAISFTFAIKLASLPVKGSMSKTHIMQKINDEYKDYFSRKKTLFNGSTVTDAQRGVIALVVRSMPGNSGTEPVLVSASLHGGEVA